MPAVVLDTVEQVQNCAHNVYGIKGSRAVILTKNIVVCFNLIIFRLNFGHRTLTTTVSEGHKNISLTPQSSEDTHFTGYPRFEKVWAR